jgi:dTDP-glucose 4,6-dehydratase
MRLLVTGGAGFIGSNYVRLVLDGALTGVNSVLVLDKLTYAGRRENLPEDINSNFEFVHGDICDQSLVDGLTKRVDAILNFAAESHVDKSIENSANFITTNVLGTHTLLESARKNNVENFIQISTDEVYGSIFRGSWDEDCPLLPNSPYSASKSSADLIALAFSRTYDMNVKITRCSNNYGPFQYPEKIIPFFITRLMKDKKVPVYGNGLNSRDWLHVTDHCRAIHLVLTKGKAGEIYNIGGGKELTNIELTKIILSELKKSEEFIEFVEDRLGHDFRYSVDYSKINKDLGYSPKINFEDGIRATINWYMDNREWWENILN